MADGDTVRQPINDDDDDVGSWWRSFITQPNENGDDDDDDIVVLEISVVTDREAVYNCLVVMILTLLCRKC